jgi:ABC-2 type transport system permease protein
MKPVISVLSQIAYNFRRELKIILHDPGAILILMIALFIYPLIYSFAYKNEVLRESDIAIVDLDNTATSRAYCRMSDATEQLRLACKVNSLAEAQELFYKGEVKGIILIPAGFEKNLLHNKQSQVVVYADAGYVLIYKQVYSGALYAASTLSGGVEVKRLLAEGNGFSQAMEKQAPVRVLNYQLFNPSGGYGSFVMPGMILIIMQQTLLIGIGMVGGSLRERKKYKA